MLHLILIIKSRGGSNSLLELCILNLMREMLALPLSLPQCLLRWLLFCCCCFNVSYKRISEMCDNNNRMGPDKDSGHDRARFLWALFLRRRWAWALSFKSSFSKNPAEWFDWKIPTLDIWSNFLSSTLNSLSPWPAFSNNPVQLV